MEPNPTPREQAARDALDAQLAEYRAKLHLKAALDAKSVARSAVRLARMALAEKKKNANDLYRAFRAIVATERK